MPQRPVAVLTAIQRGSDAQANALDIHQRPSVNSLATLFDRAAFEHARFVDVACPGWPCSDTLRDALEEALPYKGGERRLIVDLHTGQVFTDAMRTTGETELVPVAALLDQFRDETALLVPGASLRATFEGTSAPTLLRDCVGEIINVGPETATRFLANSAGVSVSLTVLTKLAIAVACACARERLAGGPALRVRDVLGLVRIQTELAAA
jgi:hypothetical protein